MQKQQEKHLKELKKCRVLGPVATIFASSTTGSWRLERPVIDYEKCIKCGTCERFCPTNVIDVYKDRAECVVINYDYCKGCGICVNECPSKCMKMIPERGEE
ncbi:MAG TPA: 2-oxoacid:acceptor oxidoreductase [Clostridiales bacterium]|nr:2-oxoacid:acceptor oxidoreductase [Clostridiales bacterium]